MSYLLNLTGVLMTYFIRLVLSCIIAFTFKLQEKEQTGKSIFIIKTFLC